MKLPWQREVDISFSFIYQQSEGICSNRKGVYYSFKNDINISQPFNPYISFLLV